LSTAWLDLLPLSIISAPGEGCRSASDGPSRAQSETKAFARLPWPIFRASGLWTVDVLFHPPPPSPNYRHVKEFAMGVLTWHLETSCEARTWATGYQSKLWAPHKLFQHAPTARYSVIRASPISASDESRLCAPCSSRPDVTAAPVSYL
jgi:hypothetical protein